MFFALIYVGLGILVVFVAHRWFTWFTSSVPVPLLIVGGIGVFAVFVLLASWGGKRHGNQSDVQDREKCLVPTQPFILYDPNEYRYEPNINYEYRYGPDIKYDGRYEPNINYEGRFEPDINWNSQYPITGKPGTRKP